MARNNRRNSPTPSVAAQFLDAAQVMAFLNLWGMPPTLFKQLEDWIHQLQPGTAEQMEPELIWDRKPAKMTMLAQADDEGHVRIEFSGPQSFIETLQYDLDNFFKKQRK